MIVEWEFLDNGTMRVKTPALEGERILPKYVADVFKTKDIIRTQDITQNGYSSIEMPSLDENTRWGHQIMVVELMNSQLCWFSAQSLSKMEPVHHGWERTS